MHPSKTGYLKSDFRIFYLTNTEARDFQSHYHDFHKLLIFESGSLSYYIEGETYQLQPWDIVLVPAGQVHRPVIHDASPYRRLIIYISPAFLEQYQTQGVDLYHCFERCARENSHVLRMEKFQESRLYPIFRELQGSAEEMRESLKKKDQAESASQALGSGEPVTVDDIGATGAVTLLLKDAIKPNLVQTLDHTPVFVHGGPFANIAHGCNSVMATKLAMKLGDYAITEAGFGADLGAEKFLDIKCRQAGLKPDAVVIVATVRALKMHGGVAKKDLGVENLDALRAGIENLEKHIENIQKYGLPSVVAINAFPTDSEAELQLLNEICKAKGVDVAISKVWALGADGGIELAEKLLDVLENKEANFTPIYELDMPIADKIKTIAKEIYGADDVVFTKKVLNKIKKYEAQGLGHLPICVAKTQYSLSDDQTLLGRPTGFKVTINELIPNTGAGFLVAISGDIMRMPGLPKVPAAVNMDIDENGRIVGLF